MSTFPQRFLESWPPDAWHGRVALVAVSGGADSMALLRLMADSVEPSGRGKLHVVHVNHGLRGQASEGDLRFVVDSAESLGVNVHTRSLSAEALSPEQTADGLEAAAREARYGFFQEIAHKVEARYLVTAHHQDDQIETVLHRILRGTGIAGLQGMASARQWLPGVGLVRPLLPFTRSEIVDYLNAIGQPWREDATNAGLDFTRNKIRNDLLPRLREAFGDQVDQSLSRLSQQATECQAVIDDLVDQLWEDSVTLADSSAVHIDLRKLKDARPYLVRELLVRVWREKQWPRQDMTQLHWQKLSELVFGQANAVADVLPGTIRAAREADLLILKRQPPFEVSFMLVRATLLFLITSLLPLSQAIGADLPPLPSEAKLAFEEDWSRGEIDDDKWYVYRKKWGNGNNGVVPENVTIGKDQVDGQQKNVLICTAHGDQYDGDVIGWWGNKTRVGGVIVSQKHFASGRFEIVMKIGSQEKHPGGPVDPMRPKGCIPALWTYGYRWVEADKNRQGEFQAEAPMYNPHIPAYGLAANEYWSELDFPEFGKAGDFENSMYNTFLQNRHDNRFFKTPQAIDGDYHTLVTEWRTHLRPMPEIRDDQVIESEGFYWIQDKSVPFESYLGNPLKKLGENRYALYEGKIATHYIDGKKVAENDKWVPAMSAQLNLGIWLPDWAGPADWKTASMKIASVKVWQYGDEGDVFGVMKGRNPDSFAKDGKPLD